MVKVLAGLLAAIMIAVAAFFGFEFYVQRQVANEVEAAFAAVRESGAKASHGAVTFDLWTRTITVADIAGESAAQPPVSVKIGRFTAAGVKPAGGRALFRRADRGGRRRNLPEPCRCRLRMRFVYKAPRIEVANYCGPAGPLRRLDPALPSDVHRFVFEHFAAVTATAITVPTVTGSIAVPAPDRARSTTPIRASRCATCARARSPR